MSLQTRLSALITAIGADIKDLKSKVSIPTVTALPSSPIDGQEIYFQTAAMKVDGVKWRLQYDAGAPGAYKWIAVGAPAPIHVQASALSNITLGAAFAITPLAASPGAIALPLAGDYDVQWLMSGFTTANYSDVRGGVTVDNTNYISGLVPSAGNGQGGMHFTGRWRLLAAAAAASLKLGLSSNTASAGFSLYERSLSVWPVRVG